MPCGGGIRQLLFCIVIPSCSSALNHGPESTLIADGSSDNTSPACAVRHRHGCLLRSGHADGLHTLGPSEFCSLAGSQGGRSCDGVDGWSR